MKLPKAMRNKIREEQEKILEEMGKEGLDYVEFRDLQTKYQVYTDMLQPAWKFTPDTALVVAGNIVGIILILNYEKLDIVRSKAMSFVLKGRV